MILQQGEKVHIIIRRNFEGDLRRHFIGEIVAAKDTLVRATGYAFVLDNTTGQFVRRPEKRIRIFGIAESGNIINVLPLNADVESSSYKQSTEGKLIVTDGKSFTLDINEFGSSR